MSLHVIDPGLATRVVDLGRAHHRELGVALGGAADRTSFILGNALVGNGSQAAALEITASGLTLRAVCDIGCVLFGAPFETGCRHVAVGTTFTLYKDDELRIFGTHRGMRTYLCVRGGFQTTPLLGSRSELETLRAGVTLPCTRSRIARRRLANAVNDPLLAHLHLQPLQPRLLRVLAGAQASWFAGNEFYEQQFTVNSASNRMGLRLQGRPLTVAPRELVSEPVSPGAVQVTKDGQCIILGVDGQTIGGYPKIAHVISADLDHLGQLRPGEKIAFQQVTFEDAETLYLDRQAQLRILVKHCIESLPMQNS